jgi:hypothetical protein
VQVQRSFEDVKDRRIMIELPESFLNHKVEVIVLTVDEETPAIRRPHPAIAGKMKIIGDVLESIPEADWNLPQ